MASEHLYDGVLRDAIEDADMTVFVDLTYPETNGAPLFAVQALRMIDSPSGNELTSQLKVHLHSLIDLRDFSLTKGTVICNGGALLVMIPRVPFYRRHTETVDVMHKAEKKKCANTQKAYTTFVNDLNKDESRIMMKILFVMPQGTVVSANLDSGLTPTSDQKVKLAMRKQKCDFETGSGAKAVQRTQEQNSGFWLLRIVSERAGVLQEEAQVDEDDLDAAFDGN